VGRSGTLAIRSNCCHPLYVLALLLAQPLVVRIFDIFLFEGDKILFRMALFLMMEWEKRLLKLDFEGLMMQLQGLPDEPRYHLRCFCPPDW